MSRTTLAGLALPALLAATALATAGGGAGGPKDPAWRPFLSRADYDELKSRSIKTILEQINDKSGKALPRMQTEAVVLAGYTLAAKDAPDAAALRGHALKLARAAGNKDSIAPELAMQLKSKLKDVKGVPGVFSPKETLPEVGQLMDLLRNKAKGGEGLAPALQYGKLKNLNGGEALIGALASKKLTATNVKKMARELELFADRVAVLGALTHAYAPQKKSEKGGTREDWLAQSLTMRDAAITLAEAARTKDATGIQMASQRLEQSCTLCHKKFQ